MNRHPHMRIVLFCLLAACGTDDPKLPPCDEVGCPANEPLFCTRDGVCGCPQPDADPIQCERPIPPKP